MKYKVGFIILTNNFYKVANPKEVFRGLTYGQWVGVWYNNLLSDKPDIVYREGKSIAFLRGNVEFSYDKQEDPKNPKNKVFSSLTNEQSITIQDDTALIIPVITTQFVLGDDYQGRVMNDELSLRSIARRDTVNGGPVGAQIRKLPNGPLFKLVSDGELDDYYVETALFPLSVSTAGLLSRTIERPIEPGTYQAIVAGIFVIVHSFEVGKYRIGFYGRGVGRYTTRSVYDIEVKGGKEKLKDISDPGVSRGQKEDNRMNFINDI